PELSRTEREILCMNDLAIAYGHKKILEHVSLTVHAGECIVVCGESGSGKTSLAKAIAGQIQFAGAIDIFFDANSSLPPRTLLVENWYRFTNLEGDRNFYYQQRY